MSQHDYNIANADGATVRADMNALNETMATLNSGTTAPTTTFANMFWADTANSLLKQRNTTNNGWITIGALDTAYWGLVSASGTNTFSGVNTFSAQLRQAKGADIASANPLVLGTDGNYFDVTGTTGFASITCTAGTFFTLQFDGACTMTHGASLNLPGGANITTAAGDEATFFATAANTVRCICYTRADGTALVSSAASSAFVFPNSSNPADGTTNYRGVGAVSATEAFVAFPVPVAITVTNIYAKCDAAPGSGKSIVVVLRKNGADTAITCTVADTATAANGTGSVSFAAGDTMDWKMTGSSTLGTTSCAISCKYTS